MEIILLEVEDTKQRKWKSIPYIYFHNSFNVLTLQPWFNYWESTRIQWVFGCIWQVGPVYPKSPIGSVSFQAETDNRKNFPDDRTFHLFKRQRYLICKT